jgi:hypothetical protein
MACYPPALVITRCPGYTWKQRQTTNLLGLGTSQVEEMGV